MAYTSIESLIAVWAEDRGLEISRADLADLAETFSAVLEPYRSLYRELDDFKIQQCFREARAMEFRL